MAPPGAPQGRASLALTWRGCPEEQGSPQGDGGPGLVVSSLPPLPPPPSSGSPSPRRSVSLKGLSPDDIDSSAEQLGWHRRDPRRAPLVHSHDDLESLLSQEEEEEEDEADVQRAQVGAPPPPPPPPLPATLGCPAPSTHLPLGNGFRGRPRRDPRRGDHDGCPGKPHPGWLCHRPGWLCHRPRWLYHHPGWLCHRPGTGMLLPKLRYPPGAASFWGSMAGRGK